MRLQDLQQVAVLGDYRQLHRASRQHPAIGRLHELDRASQNAVNLAQLRVPGMRKGYPRGDKIAICHPGQHSDYLQRAELKKLSARDVECEHQAGRQDCLDCARRDFDKRRLIRRRNISGQQVERLGDRRRRSRQVEQDADGAHVHLCRDMQSQQRIVGFAGGKLEEFWHWEATDTPPESPAN